MKRLKSTTPCLDKNCATIDSFISLKNVDRFSNFFTVIFSVKFATKSTSYISPHFKVLLRYLAKHKRPKLAKFCCEETVL